MSGFIYQTPRHPPLKKQAIHKHLRQAEKEMEKARALMPGGYKDLATTIMNNIQRLIAQTDMLGMPDADSPEYAAWAAQGGEKP